MQINLSGTALSSALDLSEQKTTGKSQNSATAEDTATLSPDIDTIAALTSTALSLPDSRQDKVAALSEAIKNGNYHIDYNQISAAILQESATVQPGQDS